MGYTVYELSTLALGVYDKDQTVIGNWTQRRDWTGPTGGFYAALYQCERRWVLAVRGTDDLLDVVPDAQIFGSWVPNQLTSARIAREEAIAIFEKNKGKSLVLTGHSLGGGLAAMLALEAKLPCVTFNAPGIARSYATQNLDHTFGPRGMAGLPVVGEWYALFMAFDPSHDSRLINIRARGDIVSVGTGARMGRVDSIGVDGCLTAWDELGMRIQNLPMDMIMNRPSGQGPSMNDLVMQPLKFNLCQHGMVLMQAQLERMPEYQRDLGW